MVLVWFGYIKKYKVLVTFLCLIDFAHKLADKEGEVGPTVVGLVAVVSRRVC